MPIKTKIPGEEKAKPKMHINTPNAINIIIANVPFPISNIKPFFSESFSWQFIKHNKQEIIKRN